MVDTAAVALRHGFDPMTFLAYSPEDWQIAVAVLERAQKQRGDEMKWALDYVSAKTAGQTAGHINRWWGRALKKLFPG